MPLYEFQCPAGHLTEVMMSTKTRLPTLPCVICGAEAERVLSAAALLRVQIRSTGESAISRAIRRVQTAESSGKLKGT